MLAIADICRIVESGFPTFKCECISTPQGLLQIKVYEPGSGRVELLLNGVSRNISSRSATFPTLLANCVQKSVPAAGPSPVDVYKRR